MGKRLRHDLLCAPIDLRKEFWRFPAQPNECIAAVLRRGKHHIGGLQRNERLR